MYNEVEQFWTRACSFQSFIYLILIFCLITKPLTSFFQLSSTWNTEYLIWIRFEFRLTRFSLFSSSRLSWCSCSLAQASLKGFSFSWKSIHCDNGMCKVTLQTTRPSKTGWHPPPEKSQPIIAGAASIPVLLVSMKRVQSYFFYSESIPDQVLGNGFLDMDGTRREHPGLEQLNIAILIPGHHPIHCWWGLKQLGLPLTKYLEFNIEDNWFNNTRLHQDLHQGLESSRQGSVST